MEKTETFEVKSTRVTHHFYCDGCGSYLGNSTEYDDGYYEPIGRYEEKFLLTHTWYKISRCLCEECAKKKTEEIYDALIKLGFVDEYKKEMEEDTE